MKIISYNPNEVSNIPAMMNSHLWNSSDDNFTMFVFNDVLEHMINKQASCSIYQEFMQKFSLPFMIFPYYAHFNKIFPDSIGKQNPRATVTLKKNGEKFDIVGMTAYGMLIVNKKKLSEIEFRFDERYAKAFYVQDIINKCFKKQIWMSSQYLIDVHESWKMFDSNFKDAYSIPTNVFLNERNVFMENNKDIPQQSINDFIKLIKENYGDK